MPTTEDILKLTISSFFYDDELADIFVLKGGNALSLGHGISNRASLDIDLSMDAPFDSDNLEEIRKTIEASLIDTFAEKRLYVFDVKLIEKPDLKKTGQPPYWGGYECLFKIIEQKKADTIGTNIDNLRRNAIKIGTNGKMSVDISPYEYCDPKQEIELDNLSIWVYTPEMIVAEKLRAICQQTEEYKKQVHTTKKPRPRDFFDIYTVMTALNINTISTDLRGFPNKGRDLPTGFRLDFL